MTEHDEFLNSVQIYTGAESVPPPGPLKVLQEGATMLQTKTQYHTAVAVQKPRDLDRVVATIMQEAKYAGSDWYYSWKVKSKDGPKLVEDGTIGLAYCLMREWTNCVCDVEYQAEGSIDVFTARFVDIERGATYTRIYKQKRSAAVGSYDSGRWEDMEFQKAQSKAIRNVIFAGVPKWLRKAAIEEAKKGVINNIERVGIAKSRQMATDFLAGYGIAQDQIEDFLHRKKDAWTAEDVAKLRGIAAQIKEGQVTPEDVFGTPAPAQDVKPVSPPPTRGRPKKQKEETPEPQPSKPSITCPREGDSVYLEWCRDNCKDQCQEYQKTIPEPGSEG